MALANPDPTTILLAGMLLGTAWRETERHAAGRRPATCTDALLLATLSQLRLNGDSDTVIAARLSDLARQVEAGTLEFYPWPDEGRTG